MRDANFQNRLSIVIYIAGLDIAYVAFTIFGVMNSVRVVEGISRAEEVA